MLQTVANYNVANYAMLQIIRFAMLQNVANYKTN